MATLIKRTWLSCGPTGRKVSKVAWGYTLQANGKQERTVDGAWTKEQARDALAARLLERDEEDTVPAPVTFGAAVERYLAAKSRKRSIADDQRHLSAFSAYFGAATPLADVTAAPVWTASAFTTAGTISRPGS